MSLDTLPGTGFNYQNLCDSEQGSVVRKFWYGICNLAEAYGITTVASSLAMRSKTVDELAPEVVAALPDGIDLRSAVEATSTLTDARHKHSTMFEVRRLVTDTDEPFWEDVRAAPSPEEAAELADVRRAAHPDTAYIIVEVRTTVETIIVDPRSLGREAWA